MAASAAKYAYCQPRSPVEYRPKDPFRPWIAPPLDFTVRATALYSLDRELDRAILSVDDLAALFSEEAQRLPGSSAAPEPGPSGFGLRLAPSAPTDPALLRQILRNVVRLAVNVNRWRPPWTLAQVAEVHATLLRGWEGAGPAGEFRREPHVTRDPDGFPLQEHCPPDRIGTELSAVVDWIDQYGPGYHPVVPVTVLLQGFQSIRPFPTGNLTTARALTVLYLHFHGLPNAELAPIGPALLEDPVLLHRLLRWTESTGSYTELVDHVLDATGIAYGTAVRRWLRRPGRVAVDDLAVRLLSRARRTPGWFSAGEAQRWVDGRRGPTVLKHLNRLVGLRLLEAAGNTRGKRFRRVSRESQLPLLLARFDEPSPSPPPTPAPSRRSPPAAPIPRTAPRRRRE
jgi:hypothetical protein